MANSSRNRKLLGFSPRRIGEKVDREFFSAHPKVPCWLRPPTPREQEVIKQLDFEIPDSEVFTVLVENCGGSTFSHDRTVFAWDAHAMSAPTDKLAELAKCIAYHWRTVEEAEAEALEAAGARHD